MSEAKKKPLKIVRPQQEKPKEVIQPPPQIAPENTPAPQPPKPKPASWAALFEHQNQSQQQQQQHSQQIAFGYSPSPTPTPISAQSSLSVNDILEPRGIINVGQTCFMNVILQSFIALPPARELLLTAAPRLSQDSNHPIVSALFTFLNEFQKLGNSTNSSNYISSSPIKPLYLLDLLLSKFRSDARESGQQQDAQEFFTFLIDSLHSEFLLAKEAKEEPKKEGKEEGWMIVEKGGKRAAEVVTTGDEFGESAISKVFFGRMRTNLKRGGIMKETSKARRSVTSEPFSCLHLDINSCSVKTVSDALSLLLSKEIVDSDSTTNVSNCIIEPFPKVICLHLKRFSFSTEKQSIIKLNQRIGFGKTLTISNSDINRSVIYHLISVVRHHGDSANRGHYTCNIFQPISTSNSNGRWFTCDDSKVFAISESVALSPNDVYLLFYYH